MGGAGGDVSMLLDVSGKKRIHEDRDDESSSSSIPGLSISPLGDKRQSVSPVPGKAPPNAFDLLQRPSAVDMKAPTLKNISAVELGACDLVGTAKGFEKHQEHQERGRAELAKAWCSAMATDDELQKLSKRGDEALEEELKRRMLANIDQLIRKFLLKT